MTIDTPDDPRPAEKPPSFRRRSVRSAALSLLIHLALLGAIIFLMPRLFPESPGLPPGVSVTVVPDEPPDSAAPAPKGTQQAGGSSGLPASPSPQPVAQAAPQPAPYIPIPADPGFNPYALAKPTEVVQSQQSPSQAPPQPSPQSSPQAQTYADAAASALEQSLLPPTLQPGNGSAGEAPGMEYGLGSNFNPSGGGATGGDKLNQGYLVMVINRIGPPNSEVYKQYLLQLIDCGVKPLADADLRLAVEAKVTFNPDGSVRQAFLTNEAQYPGNQAYKLAAARLMGVVRDPSCNHISAPASLYYEWSTVTLVFFPNRALNSAPPTLRDVPMLPPPQFFPPGTIPRQR